MALGVSHALRDADLLAAAAQRGLSGEQSMAQALRTYEQERNAATLGEYRENVQGARFLPVPLEVLDLRGELRGQAEAMTRWTKARYGMLPCAGAEPPAAQARGAPVRDSDDRRLAANGAAS